jgi:hypothetical protein
VPCSFIGRCQHSEKHAVSIFRTDGTRLGSRGLTIWEIKGLRKGSQSERRNMEKAGYLGGGLGREWSKRRNGPFQGPPETVTFLFKACFYSLKSWMRGFHDLRWHRCTKLNGPKSQDNTNITPTYIRTWNLIIKDINSTGTKSVFKSDSITMLIISTGNATHRPNTALLPHYMLYVLHWKRQVESCDYIPFVHYLQPAKLYHFNNCFTTTHYHMGIGDLNPHIMGLPAGLTLALGLIV